jgi:hypothetical protein
MVANRAYNVFNIPKRFFLEEPQTAFEINLMRSEELNHRLHQLSLFAEKVDSRFAAPTHKVVSTNF